MINKNIIILGLSVILSGGLVIQDDHLAGKQGDLPLIGFGNKTVCLDIFREVDKANSNPTHRLSVPKQELYAAVKTQLSLPAQYTSDQLKGTYAQGDVRLKALSPNTMHISIKTDVEACERDDDVIIAGNYLYLKEALGYYLEDIKALSDQKAHTLVQRVQEFMFNPIYRANPHDNKGSASPILVIKIHHKNYLEGIHLQDDYYCGNRGSMPTVIKR